MNHLIKDRSITKSLPVYLICPLAHDSASPCSFAIQQGLQFSPHKKLTANVFWLWKVMKESTVTTELGFPSASKAADVCIYVREQAAALLSNIFPLYLHEEQRERVTDL